MIEHPTIPGKGLAYVYFNMTGNSIISEETQVAVERLRTLLEKYATEEAIHSGKGK